MHTVYVSPFVYRRKRTIKFPETLELKPLIIYFICITSFN
jgi:hypothetical protein